MDDPVRVTPQSASPIGSALCLGNVSLRTQTHDDESRARTLHVAPASR